MTNPSEWTERYRLGEDFLAEYELLEFIGSGGLAEVFRARQRELDRIVAVKFLSRRFTDDGEAMARFRREARLLARLDHPNVVRVIQFGPRAKVPYLVLEYVEGESLSDRIARCGPMDPASALEIMCGICRALQAAHELGVIHRDVKCDNVLLSEQGKVKLADFGLAKSCEGIDRTAEGIIVGTPAYMAPEQCYGKPLDHRADIYSAGIVLYIMLTGKLPFEDDSTLKVLQHHVNTPPPSLDLGQGPMEKCLDELVQTALRKEPSERYRSAAAFLAALERAIETLSRTRLDDTSARLPQGSPRSEADTPARRRGEGLAAPTDETQPVSVPTGKRGDRRFSSIVGLLRYVIPAVIAVLIVAAVVRYPLSPARRFGQDRTADGGAVTGPAGAVSPAKDRGTVALSAERPTTACDESATGASGLQRRSLTGGGTVAGQRTQPPAGLGDRPGAAGELEWMSRRLVQWRGLDREEGRELIFALCHAARGSERNRADASCKLLENVILGASPGGLPYDVAAIGAMTLADMGHGTASLLLLKWLPLLPAQTRLEALHSIVRGRVIRTLAASSGDRGAVRPKCPPDIEAAIEREILALDSSPPLDGLDAAARREFTRLVHTLVSAPAEATPRSFRRESVSTGTTRPMTDSCPTVVPGTRDRNP